MPIATVIAYIARFETLTWAGLLIGMFLKYITEN